MPYLVRVLGVDYFGLLAFATVTITYCNIITDYGFNMTATRAISIHRKNSDKVTEIFSSVMTIKFILMLICFIILMLIVFTFEKFHRDWYIYYFTFGSVLGQTLFPIWFFQGIEKMRYITYLNILSKSIFTVAIFIFVHNKSDFYMVPILTSIGFLVAGILSLYIIKSKFNVKFKGQKIATLLFYIKEAHHIFIANLAISLYTVSTTFLLGLFTNNTIVGYFAVAEKIINALKSIMIPISSAIYPYISQKLIHSKQQGLIFIRKLSLVVSILTFIISLSIFIFTHFIVEKVLGHQYYNSIILIKIMAFLPFVVGISNVYAILGLYALGMQKIVMRFILKISLLHIIFATIMIYYFHAIGAGISIMLTEIIVSLFAYYYFMKEYNKEITL